MDWRLEEAFAALRVLAERLLHALSGILLLARKPQPPTGPHIRASPIRRRILDVLQERPDVTLGDLREMLDLSWAATYHHVEKLVRSGDVHLLRVGRRRLVVPREPPERAEEARARALLRGATARKVAEYVRRHPDARLHVMAEDLGESRRVVYYHVKHLWEAGVITSNSQTRHFGLRASPLLERLLAEEPSDAGPRGRAGREGRGAAGRRD